MEYSLLYDHSADTYAVIQRNTYSGANWTYYQSGLREEIAEMMLKGLTS